MFLTDVKSKMDQIYATLYIPSLNVPYKFLELPESSIQWTLNLISHLAHDLGIIIFFK